VKNNIRKIINALPFLFCSVLIIHPPGGRDRGETGVLPLIKRKAIKISMARSKMPIRRIIF
jgi:hypothetical protein